MKHLVIATTTFYKDAKCVRARCAAKMAQNARAAGIPLVVVDGGSPREFIEELSDEKALVYAEIDHSGGALGPGRRQAIKLGFDQTNNFVSCYIEAEKYCMVDFLEQCFSPILTGQYNLCIPCRASMESYPASQQLAEPLGNLYFRQLTGLDYDMFFGPRFFDATAGEHFLEYDDRFGGRWDATHIPVLSCVAADLKVVTPQVAYVHPEAQTRDEYGDPAWTYKRTIQLSNLLPAFECAMKEFGMKRS